MMFALFCAVTIASNAKNPETWCPTVAQPSCNMDPHCIWDCEESKCVQMSDSNANCPGKTGFVNGVNQAMYPPNNGYPTYPQHQQYPATPGYPQQPMQPGYGQQPGYPVQPMQPQPGYPAQPYPPQQGYSTASTYPQQNPAAPYPQQPGAYGAPGAYGQQGAYGAPGAYGQPGTYPNHGYPQVAGAYPANQYPPVPGAPMTPVTGAGVFNPHRPRLQSIRNATLNKPSYGTYPGSYPTGTGYGTGMMPTQRYPARTPYPASYPRVTYPTNNYAYSNYPHKKKYTTSTTFTYALFIITPFLVVFSFCVGKFLGASPKPTFIQPQTMYVNPDNSYRNMNSVIAGPEHFPSTHRLPELVEDSRENMRSSVPRRSKSRH